MAKVPIALMVSGFCAKSCLLLIWKVEGFRYLIASLISVDGTAWLASRICDLVFAAPHHEVPAANEYLVFDSVLILGSGIEFLCVGFVVRRLWIWIKPAGSEP